MRRTDNDAWRPTPLLLPCLLLASCPSALNELDCIETLVHIAISADDQLIANVVRQGCWAMTTSSHVVYLKRVHPVAEKSGTWGDKVYALRGTVAFDLAWRGAGLQIQAPALGSNVIFRRDQWDGIPILYQWDEEAARVFDTRFPFGIQATG